MTPSPSLPIFRASALERLLACPASGAFPQVNEESDQYAEIGTAGHAYLEGILQGIPRAIALTRLPEQHRDMCARINLESIAPHIGADVEVSYHYHANARTAIRRTTLDLLVPAWSVTGTADVVDTRGGIVRIIDWKFGRPEYLTPASDNVQLRFYALCAYLTVDGPRPKHVDAELGIVDQATGNVWFDRYRLMPDDLAALEMDLVRALAARQEAHRLILEGRTPNVSEGKHCHYCPARASCPAKLALIREFAGGPTALTQDAIGIAWERVQHLGRLIADFERRVQSWIEDHGPITLPSGKSLAMKRRAGNEVLDARIAQTVLEQTLGAELAGQAIRRTVTKVAILDAVKASGLPNSTSKAVIDQIRAAGGVHRNKDSEYLAEL